MTTQQQRDVYRADKYERDDGKPHRLHVGTETVRTARCTNSSCERDAASTAFCGVTASGWLFWCPEGHYFVAPPATA